MFLEQISMHHCDNLEQISMHAKTHEAIHDCRLWIEKQEAAFSAWLNGVLVPAKASEEGPASQALAARRLAAKVRGLLWHLYSADADVIASMLKVEKHIDAGQLRLKDEVCPCTLQCLALQHQSKTTSSSQCEACNADIHQPACTPSMLPCWLHASCDVAGRRRIVKSQCSST